jgi:hypothetical protein
MYIYCAKNKQLVDIIKDRKIRGRLFVAEKQEMGQICPVFQY